MIHRPSTEIPNQQPSATIQVRRSRRIVIAMRGSRCANNARRTALGREPHDRILPVVPVA